VRWLDEREMAAWRAYIETVGDLAAALERDLAPHSLTLGDYQVLVYLSEAEGRRLRMCDLAASLQLSPSGLTRRLDGLVEAGLVRREPCGDDRRVMLAVLTDDGYRHLAAAAPDHVESVRRHLIDRLSPRQITAMAEIFTAVRAGLDERAARVGA
jgi:DNA-binding MarR family transcriptional regulator